MVYTIQLEVLAALVQRNDDVYWLVNVSSRTMWPNDIYHNIVETEVSALVGC